MALVQSCRARDCETLTMGEFCLEHERLAETRLVMRVCRDVRRLRTPVLTLVLAACAAYLGRLSGHLGR